MELLPLKGFETVRFRMKPIQVQKILGEPSEVEKLEDDEDFEDPTMIWHYGDLSLTLFFEKNPSELISFECDHQELTLSDKRIFDLSKDEVVALMQEQGFNQSEEANEPWGELRLSFNDALVDFYFEGSKMVSVNWGVMPG